MSRKHTIHLFLLALTALAPLPGCGGSEPPPTTPVDSASSSGDAPNGNQLNVQSEIGALDEGQVQQTFERASRRLSSCFNKGVQRVAYLGGELRFKLRIKEDGSVRWAFVKESTLGDLDTETCMLDALRSTTWPKPQGGEGLAENSFTFEPSGDERPPVPWSPEQLGEPFKKARGALQACRKKAGGAAFKATLYIDTDGKPQSVGVSTADERGEPGIKCIADTLREVTFPSPGSYAAKVSVDID